jgi:hypothetical protein
LTVGQRDPLLGIDLPDLVGFGRAGSRRDAWLRSPRAVDPGADEGLLEATDGGDIFFREFFEQLNTN